MGTTVYSMSLCPWPMYRGIHFGKETPTVDGTSLCCTCMEWTLYTWSSTFICGALPLYMCYNKILCILNYMHTYTILTKDVML